MGAEPKQQLIYIISFSTYANLLLFTLQTHSATSQKGAKHSQSIATRNISKNLRPAPVMNFEILQVLEICPAKPPPLTARARIPSEDVHVVFSVIQRGSVMMISAPTTKCWANVVWWWWWSSLCLQCAWQERTGCLWTGTGASSVRCCVWPCFRAGCFS